MPTMPGKVTGPTHRRNSSDPPGGFDFASALLRLGTEDDQLHMETDDHELLSGRKIKLHDIQPGEYGYDPNRMTDNNPMLKMHPYSMGDNSTTLTVTRKKPFSKKSRKAYSDSDEIIQFMSPDEPPSDQDDKEVQPLITAQVRGARGGYKCSKCGQKKTNHLCTVLDFNHSVMMCSVAVQSSNHNIFMQDGDRFLTVRKRPLQVEDGAEGGNSHSHPLPAVTGQTTAPSDTVRTTHVNAAPTFGDSSSMLSSK